MRLFIDTNVVLDFLLQREPFYAHAARLFNVVEVDGHEAFVSAISFNNVFYIARKSIGTERAKDLVRNLRKLCQTVPLDDLIIDRALAVSSDDFEDGIQAMSAWLAKTPFIVTRNARDFEKTKLQAYAPEEVLALLDHDSSSVDPSNPT